MPIKRYTVGRVYTKRTHAPVALTDLDGMRALMNALASSDPTVEGRLADAERRATAHLKRAKMPLDPRARPYGDPTWLRDNERKSLDWYAISILNTVQILRKQIERGDVRLAVDLALDLGVLVTEAKMIQYMASNPARGGKDKAAARRAAVAQDRAQWCAEADRLWKPPRQKWGALAIAKLIDPTRFETIRKVIADRKPPLK